MNNKEMIKCLDGIILEHRYKDANEREAICLAIEALETSDCPHDITEKGSAIVCAGCHEIQDFIANG